MDVSSCHVSLQLKAALTAIDNSLTDREISTAMEQTGYSKNIILEGRQLYDAAVAAVSRYSIIKEELHNAQSKIETAKSVAKHAITSFYDMAKASFGNGMLTTLGLTGPKRFLSADFTASALNAFDTAIKLPVIQATLLAKGYDQVRLHSERMKISTYAMYIQTFQAVKDALKLAHKEQGNILQTLRAWLAEYLQKTEIALGDRPHLLEKLGIVVHARSRVALSEQKMLSTV
jgi:hypothetical protein